MDQKALLAAMTGALALAIPETAQAMADSSDSTGCRRRPALPGRWRSAGMFEGDAAAGRRRDGAEPINYTRALRVFAAASRCSAAPMA